VPELIITFIQILSAASDIPATRFIGQAPGGLNATGTSDLENYYNVIDAIQGQKIEPCLRRTYDLIGYQMYPTQWPKVREELNFIFPPLWNLSELEEADRNTKALDNIIKALENRIITESEAIQEINARNIFSIDLTGDDMELRDLLGTENPLGNGTTDEITE
jgi:phage-related protein (TIGR01555 family)